MKKCMSSSKLAEFRRTRVFNSSAPQAVNTKGRLFKAALWFAWEMKCQKAMESPLTTPQPLFSFSLYFES